MTVPPVHSFRSLSDKFPNDFFKSNFSHFTYQVRLFFVEKRKPKNFGFKKCVGERISERFFFLLIRYKLHLKFSEK